MKQAFRLTPVIAALGVAAGLAFSAGAQAQTIKIGVVGPTTGAVTQYGDMVREGVDTAVERINAAGGINGKKLETVVIDDGCEPKQGPVAANRVVNSKIGFVVGHVCSGATIAAADVYNNEGVVMVTPSATSPALTDGKNYEFIFRTIGRDDQQGPAAAKFILEKLKPKKAAVLHDKQSYGQGIATAVKNDLEKGGVPVAIFEGINAGDSDYSAVITKLKSQGVDFVYYGGYHPEMGLLLRQAAEQGVKAKWMGPEGTGNPDINAIAGDAVEGMLLTLPADFTQNAANAEIVKAFAAKKRNAAGAFQMTAYTATQVIADGIKGAGSEDPTKVAKYLHANSFDTPIGKVSWNKQGDLTNFQFDVFVWHKDGSKSVYK
ncbi:branched-chain amino acid ABC transporter substrate-binding protein [Achromobacter xylosoxidans]|jgi:branched-chain amino acid transport system substrate-binding protein|uniref:Branched-chain amino acid ABC transporter substrate-binding protein n=2 Tax=Alcaligenes xylosoxydans xylosoxydans TaxID=85698 RepID=A0A0D6HJS3_ALCXX|nr:MULTISPECIES: branched-chain amino acid ABC transporter substrate-binding protein [Achromobacter]AHC47212.1 Branched-chain amino acid ABC transporter, amino acid-binding protein [Achromobacter xylosoxidans NBRC 15126 = ATCC 27061]AMH07035.1 branched-chain amino acid ABC transporter substrate-binding protein [Achromobacter xylosoxidans]AXA77699.1 branched-chain amino acid ABC transporter substrate-binding protein [Achromobacter xylosoxidans]EFV85264.1 Leu/Ile/Val-binding protein [Achromobacte